MSRTAVIDRPVVIQDDVDWIVLDESTVVDLAAPALPAAPRAAVAPAQQDLIEIKPVVTVFESQDAMRFGSRTYSDRQLEFIDRTVRARRPLTEPPLSLDD